MKKGNPCTRRSVYALALLLAACADPAGPIPSEEAGSGGDGTGGTQTGSANGGTGTTPPVGQGGTGSPSGGGISFDNDVHPILVANCGNPSCHGMAGGALPGHGTMDANAAFAEVQKDSSRGGKIFNRIVARAGGTDPAGFMPPSYEGCEGPLGTGTCLDVAEFETIEAWVEQGAMAR
jgi:hypothetical protein